MMGLISYRVRLTKRQLQYLRAKENGSEFVREAIDEKIAKEEWEERNKPFIKPPECKDEWKCNECPRYACSYGNPNKRKATY